MPSRTRRGPRPSASLILGILVLLAPVVMTQWSNLEQERIAAGYSQSAASLDDAQRQAALDAARAYNARLAAAPLADPWGGRPDATSPAYREYLGLLDLDSVMARVRIPAVGIDAPAYHGTDQSTLAVGVGHVYGSALPVGGEGTHAVLAGHTGLATATMFDNLSHVRDGDLILLDVLGETLAYQVDRIATVLPTELDAVRPEAGRDLVTLVTCTPYGINTHRLLVRAERVPVPAELPERTYTSLWQPWMIGVAIVIVLVVAYLVWLAVRRRRAEARREDALRGELA